MSKPPKSGSENLTGLVADFAVKRNLGTSFVETAEAYYLPLLFELERIKKTEPLVLGINGAQGSGKSTLGEFLAFASAELFGWRVTCLSLDDLYLSKAARRRLASEVHPLLQTRGVPGTHDLKLGVKVLDGLRNLDEGDSVAIPRFDKASDDLLPESKWDIATGRQDLIVFEGWCMACPAQLIEELAEPANELEATEDAEAVWRHFVNQNLLRYEEQLWSQLDLLVMLKVPSFEQVYQWRSEQEAKLVEALGYATELSDPAKMRRFISHYERLTKHMLVHLETRVHILMRLDKNHAVCSMRPDLPPVIPVT